MGTRAPELLTRLLQDVSRSFYLTLRVLPGTIRPQIGLAYLLARATDTIADTDALPKQTRLAALDAARSRICEGKGKPLRLDDLAGRQTSPGEQALLQRIEEAASLLDDLNSADRERVRQVLAVIISGQVLDLERFAQADVDHIACLENDQQLDDYTYRVAGCVGEFWTRMCRAHAFPTAGLDDAFLLANGVRFGKGLQLVNVLRDLSRDLRLGRCYLPKAALTLVGLEARDLLEPSNESRLRPLYEQYLHRAEEHLEAGWAYTNHLPWSSIRIRLACAWPILIGVQTVARLRAGRILDPNDRIRISRQAVRQVLLRSVLVYPAPRRWHGLLERFSAPRRKPLPEPASLAK
jgi:farnesyl-diphosphate farnesyltransferase